MDDAEIAMMIGRLQATQTGQQKQIDAMKKREECLLKKIRTLEGRIAVFELLRKHWKFIGGLLFFIAGAIMWLADVYYKYIPPTD